jgi:23S rRNA (adenine2030-N6)-methyltransferase
VRRAIIGPEENPVLSYRHAFHAGNHADVLKHVVLAACLEYLGRKPTPYLYVDTHAGPGSYRLEAGYAARNREWVDGVARLGAAASAAGGAAPPAAVAGYLAAVAAFRARRGADAYPGSPAIALDRLRPADAARLFELHPTDFPLLAVFAAGDGRCVVRREDGLVALPLLLPPPSRRGLILVDPSYEVKTEYASVVEAVAAGLRRFATGVYLVWYPLLAREEARALPGRLLALAPGTVARIELSVAAPSADGFGMPGSGLVAFNPPWTLRAELEAVLPYLARTLGAGGEAGWRLDWREKAHPDATAPDAPGTN